MLKSEYLNLLNRSAPMAEHNHIQRLKPRVEMYRFGGAFSGLAVASAMARRLFDLPQPRNISLGAHSAKHVAWAR